MSSTDKRLRSGGGCGYLLFVVVTGCILFIVNTGVMGMVFSWCEARQPWIGSDLRLKQAVMFLFPVVMVLMQYWIYDFITDRVSAVRNQVNS